MLTELTFEQQVNKDMAVGFLDQTDWTVTGGIADPAVSNPYLTNQAEFLSYRSAVRNIAVNPPTSPTSFPTMPIAIWSS
jgi:hypothetical protein